MKREYRSIAIAIPVWGLIQAGLVFAVDRQPGPTILWFLIFVAVSSGSFASTQVMSKIRMWMLIHVPLYQRWAMERFHRRKHSSVNPLHGVYLGLLAGPLVGPVLGICISQLYRPQTPGVRAAWIGMLVAIACLSVLRVDRIRHR